MEPTLPHHGCCTRRALGAHTYGHVRGLSRPADQGRKAWGEVQKWFSLVCGCKANMGSGCTGLTPGDLQDSRERKITQYAELWGSAPGHPLSVKSKVA